MKEDPDQRPPSQAQLLVRNLQRRHPVDTRALTRFLREAAAVAGAGPSSATVALVGDARIRSLNREYRGYDKPTDVLAFAAQSSADPDSEAYLGDIVISVETAARRRGPLPRELRVLVLHGLLHLLGYDHEADEGEMRRLEYRLRKKLGITRPRTAGQRPRRTAR